MSEKAVRQQWIWVEKEERAASATLCEEGGKTTKRWGRHLVTTSRFGWILHKREPFFGCENYKFNANIMRRVQMIENMVGYHLKQKKSRRNKRERKKFENIEAREIEKMKSGCKKAKIIQKCVKIVWEVEKEGTNA